MIKLAPFFQLLTVKKGFVLTACIAVGIFAGLAASILKRLCEFCQSLAGSLTGDLSFWLLPALPGVGILLCVIFVKFHLRGFHEKGLSGVIAATTKGTSDLKPDRMYAPLLTSGVCVGLGGSAGLEAPIALAGAAIGSNTAKKLGLSGETRTLLLACGGAGGIAAVFNSPVAGALFACEVLLPEFSVPALVPLLMASAAATVVAGVLHPAQPFIKLTEGWSMDALPFYVLLGILAGLVSAYVMRAGALTGRKFEAIGSVWTKALAASAFLYASFLLLPSLRGEGYGQIANIVSGHFEEVLGNSPLAGMACGGWLFLLLIAVLALFKVIVSEATISGGGDGGIFAPSMFTGAFTGLFLARGVNLTGLMHLNEINFIAAGMGGVLSGVMHAPMTGIFLIAEITGGYKLLVPLMIVSALACFTSKRLEQYNVYKRKLNKSGFQFEPNPDAAAIESTGIREILETDFLKLKENDSLRTMIKGVMDSKRNVFPVLDDSGRIAGIVTLDRLRPFLLDSQLYDMALVYDIMEQPGPLLKEGSSLAEAAHLFGNSSLWHIPVENEKGEYLGFISKSGVFDKYRKVLREKPELF